MSYQRQNEFLSEIVSEFGINQETFRCYTVESIPCIKIVLFGREKWDACHIGFLIDKKFHVLGVGSYSFINEDVKALYAPLAHAIPQRELKLIHSDHSLFDDEEQAEITTKLAQLFPKQ